MEDYIRRCAPVAADAPWHVPTCKSNDCGYIPGGDEPPKPHEFIRGDNILILITSLKGMNIYLRVSHARVTYWDASADPIPPRIPAGV